MLQLDGSYGSGGGQMLRTALALSTLTQIPFRMINIRSGRKNPGLKAQHTACISALEKLSNSQVKGAKLKNSEITFIPGKYTARNEEIDIGTAGSITLLLQSLLLPAIFTSKPHTLTITGGTDVLWSMSADYINQVLLPQIKRFCQDITISIKKRGYYPKGGGKIELKINPTIDRASFENFADFKKTIISLISPFLLTKKPILLSIHGNVNASNSLIDKDVANRIVQSAKQKLSFFNVPVDITTEYSDTLSIGVSVTLWAKCNIGREFDVNNPVIIGVDSLGEKNIRAEKIGEIVADKLIKEINSRKCVDEHLADNLIPFMSLLPNSQIKTSKISEHTKTNIYIVEQFLGKIFEIKKDLIKTKNS